jgi:hypothetical protein
MHGIAGAMHSVPQMPAAHVGCALTAPSHTVPQAPQFDVSVCVSTQLPLQLAAPFGQSKPQLPAAHTSSAPQGVSQSPQCAASVRVSTHSSPHFV